jgi:putative phage-type endonuclease
MSDDATITSFDTREEWLEARRQGIGGTDAAAILGVSPWKSPAELYAEKLGLVDLDNVDNEAAVWGLLLQPLLVQRYRRVTGRMTVPEPLHTIRRSRAHPWMLASLDATIHEGGLVLPCEIKTTGAYRVEDWAEEPPVHVQVQVQHQLAVTGAPWASVAVLIGGQRFHWCDVQRDDRFIAAMIQAEQQFLERLRAKEPPAIDGSAACRELLAKLYPKEQPGLVVNLDERAEDIDISLIEANAELAKWKAVKELKENEIKALLGEAEMGVLPGGRVVYSLKTQTRKGYTVEPTSFRKLFRKEIKG